MSFDTCHLNFNNCIRVQRPYFQFVTFEKEPFMHISTQIYLNCKLQYSLDYDSLEKATFFSFTNLITTIENNFSEGIQKIQVSLF